jgi:hypothetical protein
LKLEDVADEELEELLSRLEKTCKRLGGKVVKKRVRSEPGRKEMEFSCVVRKRFELRV